MTYAELKTMIQDFLECSETSFVAHLDDFIIQAEDEIYRRVQLPDLRKATSSTTTTASDKFVTLPSDFLSAYSVAIVNAGSHEFLLNKDVNFIREAYPVAATEGTPRYYAIYDDTKLIVAPTPDDTYTVDMQYFYKPTSLTAGADSGTTWLSSNGEAALMYGSIMYAYTYLKGDQDVFAQYQRSFEDAIKSLLVIAEGRNKKDSYRKPDGRLPV